MPIDYSNYPANWKTEIRPRILERAGNKCEICNIPNGQICLRGEYDGIEVWQDDNGQIFRADNSEHIGEDYLGEVHPTNKLIKVVLTIAHLDHCIEHNEDENLKALCQFHHNRHDKEHRAESRKKNKKQIQLL